MSKALVIVESPAKANTINKFLGAEYTVRSSMGHIKDLPQSKMGVDTEHDFKPQYVTIPQRKKVITQLNKDLAGKTDLYLAADPDREGEAICWHLANTFGKKLKVHRVEFHEITKEAVVNAFLHPRKIDMDMVNAQQARRILDRLVGYSLSPLLWKKVGRGLSAGRVQSVALRLIVDRERQIKAFVPEEYWEIEAELKKRTPEPQNPRAPEENKTFKAKLEKIDGKEPSLKNNKEAEAIVKDLQKADYVVADVKQSQKIKNPQAPFTTSKLQQEAFNKLRFPAAKTMRIAQQLYEGVPLGKEEHVGLITYMRTDSVNISKEALEAARGYILKKFGRAYLPAVANKYKSKKNAQEAHEAIRPSSVNREPGQMEKYLTPEQYRLYELIYNRFVASQMRPAVYSVITVDINAKKGKYLFRTSASRCIFPGFCAVYPETKNEEPPALPEVKKDEPLDLVRLSNSQHFTKPPARFSDASLIKALEEEGIGRPSTYVPIIETIATRDYIRRESGYLSPTELGIAVCDLLIKHFPEILDIKFTAYMEDELDQIEEGRLEWVGVLKEFYSAFDKTFKKAQANMKEIKKEVVQTDEACDKCGKPMVIKWGRNGRFLSCSDFPRCRNAKSLPTGAKCPKCGADVVQRRSKKGSFFFGCGNYPNCDYITRRLPKPQEGKVDTKAEQEERVP